MNINRLLSNWPTSKLSIKRIEVSELPYSSTRWVSGRFYSFTRWVNGRLYSSTRWISRRPHSSSRGGVYHDVNLCTMLHAAGEPSRYTPFHTVILDILYTTTRCSYSSLGIIFVSARCTIGNSIFSQCEISLLEVLPFENSHSKFLSGEKYRAKDWQVKISPSFFPPCNNSIWCSVLCTHFFHNLKKWVLSLGFYDTNKTIYRNAIYVQLSYSITKHIFINIYCLKRAKICQRYT